MRVSPSARRPGLVLCLCLLLFAGCASGQSHDLSERPWNRQTKAEVARGWWFFGNDEQAEAWRKNPYP